MPGNAPTTNSVINKPPDSMSVYMSAQNHFPVVVSETDRFRTRVTADAAIHPQVIKAPLGYLGEARQHVLHGSGSG
jgi:hypothetical protein